MNHETEEIISLFKSQNFPAIKLLQFSKPFCKEFPKNKAHMIHGVLNICKPEASVY